MALDRALRAGQRLLTLFVLLILAGRACAQDQTIVERQKKLEEAKKHYAQGQRLIKEGDYAAANTEFAKAELLLKEEALLVQAPLPRETHAAPGDAAKKEQIERAMRFYLDEIKKETNSPDFYYNLALEYLRKGQFMLAEEYFKLTLNVNPLDKDAAYNLGILYENYLNDKEKAIVFYQQYLNIAPDAPDAKEVRQWIKDIKLSMGKK